MNPIAEEDLFTEGVKVGKSGQLIATSGTQCWEYDVHRRSGGMSITPEPLVRVGAKVTARLRFSLIRLQTAGIVISRSYATGLPECITRRYFPAGLRAPSTVVLRAALGITAQLCAEI